MRIGKILKRLNKYDLFAYLHLLVIVFVILPIFGYSFWWGLITTLLSVSIYISLLNKANELRHPQKKIHDFTTQPKGC